MYIVTGGAGFIGSNIVASLEAQNVGNIAVVDRLRTANKWKNLAKRALFDIINPDEIIAGIDAIHSRREKIRGIFHMGAISATTETDCDLIFNSNFRLSVALWNWCTRHEVPFIYASSAATYGNGEMGFTDDESPEYLARLRPMNPYGWSKLLFDRWVKAELAQKRPQPPQWVGLKFFNVYGPNEYHKGGQQSVVAHVFPRAKAGETARLFRSHNPQYQDGGQLRDFVSVKDCVNVMMWLKDNPKVSGIFNIGTGKARSFLDLASSVYRALGQEPLIEYVDTPLNIRDKYQYFTQADMRKLRTVGYDQPFSSLEDGISDYVQNYLAQEDAYR